MPQVGAGVGEEGEVNEESDVSEGEGVVGGWETAGPSDSKRSVNERGARGARRAGRV